MCVSLCVSLCVCVSLCMCVFKRHQVHQLYSGVPGARKALRAIPWEMLSNRNVVGATCHSKFSSGYIKKNVKQVK